MGDKADRSGIEPTHTSEFAEVAAPAAGEAAKRPTLRRLRTVGSWLVTVALVGLIVAVVGLRLTGWNFFTVLTGSMEPNINRGDVVIVAPVAPKVGDVATFADVKNTTTTHRVIRITESQYITAGDATGAVDDPRDKKNLIGTVKLTVPFVGWLGPYSPYWPVVLSAVVAAIVLMFAWPLLRRFVVGKA